MNVDLEKAKAIFLDALEKTPEESSVFLDEVCGDDQALRSHLDLLLEAHRKATAEATDDAALVEEMGGRVRVYTGSPRNIKVTTPEDLALAEALLGLNT